MIFNISSIINEPFLINGDAAQGFLPTVAAMLNGSYVSNVTDFAAERKRLAPYVLNVVGLGASGTSAASSGVVSSKNSNKDYIGVIQVNGVVLKDDQKCGPRGTKSLTAQVKAYNNDDYCVGLIGVIDTPGGQVSYTDLFADAIRNFAKPSAAFVEGSAASAGYWLASAFDNIYASSSLNSLGSIGAFLSIKDFSSVLEKMGVNVVEIYAPQSTDKNKLVTDALKGNTEGIANEVLKPIVDKFIADVSINRTEIDPSVFTGKMYQANKAIEMGMLDGIKSFEEVAQSIVDRNNELNEKNKDMNTAEKKYPNVAKAAGFDDETIVLTDAHANLAEESIDALETRLADVVGLETSVSDLTTEKETLTAAQTDLQTKYDALVTEFDVYKAKPGASGASGKKDGDSFVGENGINVDDFAHNKKADELLGK